MKQRTYDNLEAAWARLGVLFNVRPARGYVDPERLLIETARACDSNPRLLPLAVSWLVVHGVLIARHRLKRLVREESDSKACAVLGLIIDSALQAGAFPDPHRPSHSRARVRHASTASRHSMPWC